MILPLLPIQLVIQDEQLCRILINVDTDSPILEQVYIEKRRRHDANIESHWHIVNSQGHVQTIIAQGNHNFCLLQKNWLEEASNFSKFATL
jgi:hypothetical protein